MPSVLVTTARGSYRRQRGGAQSLHHSTGLRDRPGLGARSGRFASVQVQAQSPTPGRQFRAIDFTADILQYAKGDSRVSVVIPVRNEAATIGEIVQLIHTDLVAGSGLVDELLVIDSDSSDDTAVMARQAGAIVHHARDIRPELGWVPGKGEAMWKSLFVSTGEIVVFIDGDLTSFTSSYVTGLLGPLLNHSDVQLVKAFYDRDLGIAADGTAQGGRVTELMARPLISSWWPELSGVIQPLAGEWAVRRSLLQTLSIPCGYGVEFAVLIDTYNRLGPDAIAQVDLGVRTHLHQDLASLGAMATEVLSAASRRRFGDVPSTGTKIVHPARAAGAEPVTWTTRSINDTERPPHDSMTAK